MDACEAYARRWAKKEDVELDTLSEWIKSIGDVLKRRIRRLKHSVNTRHESIFSDPDVVSELSCLHESFVIYTLSIYILSIFTFYIYIFYIYFLYIYFLYIHFLYIYSIYTFYIYTFYIYTFYIYTVVVSRTFMTGAASQAGDADSSRAPSLTSGVQGSVNGHRGALLLVPLTVHQLFFNLHFCHSSCRQSI